MEIKVLGTGCVKCKKLETLTKKIIEENNIDASVTKVEDIFKIMQYGVKRTPALIINNKIVWQGSLPSKEELDNIFKQL